MKALGKAQETSVNDILLTVIDMALNRYLAEKGRPADARPLVVDMPVALSSGPAEGGNKIAVLQFPLGAALSSPLERLKAIHRRTAEVKQHVRKGAEAMVAYTAGVHGVPALLELLKVERAPMMANMMISNPFGLPERRYLAGAELEMALPVSVLPPGQSLNVTAVTYAEALQVSFLGLAAELPDISRLAEFATTAFEDLKAACEPPRSKTRRAPKSSANA
jgi:hypothetical protein